MENECTLSSLKEGDYARVVRLYLTGTIRRRLQDIGLIAGTEVQCVFKSPWGDPIAFEIRGAVIALRIEDAASIVVTV